MGVPTETAEIFSLWNCSSEVTKGLLAPRHLVLGFQLLWFEGKDPPFLLDSKIWQVVQSSAWHVIFQQGSRSHVEESGRSLRCLHMFTNVYGHRKIENELLNNVTSNVIYIYIYICNIKWLWSHQIYVNHFQVQTQAAAGLSPDLPCVSSQPAAQKLWKPLWPTNAEGRDKTSYISDRMGNFREIFV